MKIKYLSLLPALCLTACASISNQPKPTAEELLSKLCPLVTLVKTDLALFPNVDPVFLSKVEEVKPYVEAVCSSGAIPSVENLSKLSQVGVPMLISAIGASPFAATPKGMAIIAGVNLAQIIIPQIISVIK